MTEKWLHIPHVSHLQFPIPTKSLKMAFVKHGYQSNPSFFREFSVPCSGGLLKKINKKNRKPKVSSTLPTSSTLAFPRTGICYIIPCPFLSPLPFSLKNVWWINCENLMIFLPDSTSISFSLKINSTPKEVELPIPR